VRHINETTVTSLLLNHPKCRDWSEVQIENRGCDIVLAGPACRTPWERLQLNIAEW